MLRSLSEQHRIPGGRYSLLYNDMPQQTHLLIAGRTGSGKSVVVNGIIHSMLCQRSCDEEQLILVDPKRVELLQWKSAPHCLFYSADNPVDRLQALNLAVTMIEKRFEQMDEKGIKRYDGGDIHVVIDELADWKNPQWSGFWFRKQFRSAYEADQYAMRISFRKPNSMYLVLLIGEEVIP